PWLKPIVGPGGDQLIIRHQNDIYEISLHDNILTTDLIFHDLRILDDILATSFLFDKKHRRLFIATLTSGFLIVTQKPFRALAFTSANRVDNTIRAFLLLPGKKILTPSGILDKRNSNDHRLFTPAFKPDGNCFFKARNRSIWASKEKRLHIY